MNEDVMFLAECKKSGLTNNIMKFASLLMMLSIFAFPDITLFSYASRFFWGLAFVFFWIDKKIAIDRVYLIWVFVFFTIGMLNIIVAFDQDIAIKTFVTAVQAILISFMLAHWLKITKSFISLFNSIIISATLFCFRLIRYIDFSTWGKRKVGSMMGINVNSIGIRIAIAFIFSIFLARCCKLRIKKVIYYVDSILLSLLILVTGSRRALVIIFVAFVLILILTAENSMKKLGAVFIILFFAFAAYLMMTQIPQFYAIIGLRMERFISALFNSGSALDGGRDVMVQRSLQLFSEKPLLGWGMGNFRYVSGIDHEYSHNTYVELLYATGILGFVSYYSILLIIMLRLKSLSKNSIQFIICISMLACMIISDVLAVNYTSVVAHLLIALVLAISSTSQGINNTRE